MRKNGWLQEVFAEASQRVEEWPEWKKEIEPKKSDRLEQEPSITAKADHSKLTNSE